MAVLLSIVPTFVADAESVNCEIPAVYPQGIHMARANANQRIRRIQSDTIYRAARLAVMGSFSNSCRGSRLGVGSSTITPTYPIIISSQVCSP